MGVFCQSNSGNSIDSLHFLNNCLIIFTAFSAFIFDCGYVEDDVTWSKPRVLANTENSVDVNCCPLSVIWDLKSCKDFLQLFDDVLLG